MFPLRAEDRALQDEIRNRRHQQDHAIQCSGDGFELVFAHPRGHERKQRQPEQQVQIGPHDAASNAVGGMQHVMMVRSEEHTSELQSLMRISYAVFCLKKKKTYINTKVESKKYYTNDTNTFIDKRSHFWKQN